MLPTARLLRMEESDYGTLGMLIVGHEIFCATLEPPDLLNAQNVSSIPAQQYLCERYSSNKYPDTFEVKKVPNRSGILFHPGNTLGDTSGCILLGSHHGKLAHEQRAVLNSGVTFAQFMALLKDHLSFHLTIKEVY